MDPAENAANNAGELTTTCAGECENHDSSTKTGDDRLTSTSDASRAEKGEIPSCPEPAPCKKSKYSSGWRRIVRNFTPSWFAVNMGTGIVSILLHNLLYNGQWLQYISYIFFALNVALFVLFFFLSLLRYTLYPRIWMAMIRHPAQSLFLGCFPMGLATIINMVCFVCVPKWGREWWRVAWTLWWTDTAIASAICVYLPFVIMRYHEAKLENITAAWLLPIVSTIVAAATGSIVAGILPHPQWQLITIITSYVLWGEGVSLAMCVLVLYFLRLTTHTLPPKAVIVSVFLPLGPLGQGGYAIQNLGKVAREVFRETHTLPQSMTHAGDILYVVGVLIAMIMWGFWSRMALLRHCDDMELAQVSVQYGLVGLFTFPLGVYSVCTMQLAKELPSAFFRVVGTAFAIAVLLLWIAVASGTLWKAWTGEILAAPCLKGFAEDDMKVHLLRRDTA